MGQERLEESLGYVGMDTSVLDRYPHQLSGGQRQRVMIARALMMQPKLLIADEATSMLDASLRVNVLNVLQDLRDELGMTVLFITHDIGQACYLADQVLVMEHGVMVEQGPTDDVIFNPAARVHQAAAAPTCRSCTRSSNSSLREELHRRASWPAGGPGHSMRRIELRTGWTVRADRRRPCRSGCPRSIRPRFRVGTHRPDGGRRHPDPVPGRDEEALRWMYAIDWRYATTLDAPRPHGPPASSSTLSSTASTRSERFDCCRDHEIELGVRTTCTARTASIFRSHLA